MIQNNISSMVPFYTNKENIYTFKISVLKLYIYVYIICVDILDL